MMVRMTESLGNPAAVDAVFELKGQKVYDVVPGAFIAKQAGATIVDLSGKSIDLHEALRHHKSLMTYVLAATKDLADELVSVLKYKAKNEDEAKNDTSAT